jgi:hypothetical protein
MSCQHRLLAGKQRSILLDIAYYFEVDDVGGVSRSTAAKKRSVGLAHWGISAIGGRSWNRPAYGGQWKPGIQIGPVAFMYRTRAVAGIGSACGLGASPTPDLRESARAVPTYTQIPPGCTPRLQWGSVVAWSSTAVTTGFVRGHRTPGSSHDQQPTDPPRHPPQMHTYVQTAKSSTCSQVQSSLLKASTTNLTGPVATPAPPAA